MQLKLSVIFLFIWSTIYAQNIIVDDQRTAQDLIQNVLFNNTGCATISNFSVSGGDFGTGENSYGYFDATGTVFPFQEGIVLSTGKAIHTQGPNNTLSDDDGINWGTDIDLENVLGINNTTFNATILEFDFIPLSNFVSFDYIFASEEYQEGDPNTCTFSDVFTFLIKSQGGNYTNIAVVPNTQTPVEVTTVHPEIPNGCPAVNEVYFGSWNDSSYQPINFNGQTAILQAQSVVVPNTTYHIKLVIADHINFRFDSAVFLKANSFNIGIDLGENRLITTGNALCGNETLPLDAGIANTYQWLKFNPTTQIFDSLVGETNQTLTITPALGSGTYKVEASLGLGCISDGEIIVEYDSLPNLNNADLLGCVDDTFQIANFNLFDAFSQINNGDTTLVIENFFLNQPDANSDTAAIPNPTNYTNTVQGQVVVARVRNTSGCVSFANVTLTVHQNPEIKANESVFYCLNEFPTQITLESGFINGFVTDYTYQWYKNGDLLVGEIFETLDVNTIGNYTIEITNTNLCTVERTITVLPSEIATIENVLLTESEFYEKVSVIIEVSGTGTYEYAIDIDPSTIDNDENYQDENVFNFLFYGTHIIYVRDKNGCGILEKEIHLLKFSKFFTPNNDGIHDTWNIDNLDAHDNSVNSMGKFNTVSDVTIFDRFGKVLAVINPKGLGWNGNFKGKKMPKNSYWFTVDLIDYNGKIITKKGHFSLQR